jgi:hypothetical protein
MLRKDKVYIKLNYSKFLDISSFLVEIDNEMDAMQATILHLQSKLNSYSHLEKTETTKEPTESNGTQETNMDTNSQT